MVEGKLDQTCSVTEVQFTHNILPMNHHGLIADKKFVSDLLVAFGHGDHMQYLCFAWSKAMPELKFILVVVVAILKDILGKNFEAGAQIDIAIHHNCDRLQ